MKIFGLSLPAILIALLVAAAGAGWYVYQSISSTDEAAQEPLWSKERFLAGGAETSNPAEAKEHYLKALAAANQGVDPIAHNRLFNTFSDFLYKRGEYQQAKNLDEQGLRFAQRNKLPEQEAFWLVSIADCQHELFRAHKSKAADPQPVERALKIFPQSSPNLSYWRAQIHFVLGQTYTDNRQFSKGEENLKLALAGFANTREIVRTVCIADSLIDNLVAQHRYADANRVFISSSIAHPTFSYSLKETFSNAVRDILPSVFVTSPQLLLSQGKFDELEKLIDDLRTSRKCYASGTWYLDELYKNISTASDGATDVVWLSRLSDCNQWISAKPNSSAAKIALAYVLTDYAWNARGSGAGNSVSDERAKLMGGRLRAAQESLDAVRDKPPEWYSAMQEVALGQSWGKKQYDAMVDEGRKKHPDYWEIIFHKDYWLQPRWYGEPGEFESYIAKESNALGGEDGDMLYARAAWQLDNQGIEFYKDMSMSWPRVKKGFADIIKENPLAKDPRAIMARVELSKLALLYGDKPAAEAAFNNY